MTNTERRTISLPVDEYDRVLLPANERPPIEGRIDGKWIVWRNRVVAHRPPDRANSAVPDSSRHDANCVDGWFPSDSWWLHCWQCRKHLVGATDQPTGGGQ